MSRWFKHLVAAVSACAAGAVLLVASGAGASTGGQVRLGSAPARPGGAKLVGALASSTPLNVTVVLKPRDAAALQAAATAVSTPGSPTYRHFISVAQFRQRFAPTDAQIAAVVASLRAHGLNPGAVSANGLAIRVRSTAGAIGHAFSTSLERVALRSGRRAFLNAQPPLLDASVAGDVQGVLGLDNLAVPHPVAVRAAHPRPRAARHVVTGGPQPCPTASAAAASLGSYTADQIASAYSFSGLYGAGDQGTGQTVAIFELEGNFPQDINAYKACFGANTSVSYSSVDGGPPPANASNFDGLETELDIEQVIGLAPQATVHVYQGPYFTSATDANVYDTYNAMVLSGAKMLSTSWGLCEPQDTAGPRAENTLFEEAATQGQSVFAASGDTGSEDCSNPNGDPVPALAVDDPSSQPFVTGVGGTTLAAIGPPPAEYVWNDPALSGVCADLMANPIGCGGGGGISSLWPMPTYQSGTPAALNVINSNSSGTPCGAPAGTYCREVPDVSAVADPLTGVVIYWDGNGSATDPKGWGAIGGTSVGAPLWAALMADVNAYGACGGSPVGFANPVLYGTAGNVYSGHFNDVTTGNNDILGANGGLFPAGPRYDMASGLGTPNATALAQNLCAPAIGVSNPGTQTSMLHRAATVRITASDTSGRTLNFSATGLPPGLSINSTTGAISGTLTQAGAYNVTVRAFEKDRPGSFGSSTFAWKVLGPPTQSGGALTGLSKGQPKLTFGVSQGAAAPGLAKLVVTLPHGLSFSRNTRNLRKGITVNGSNGKRLSRYKVSLSHGHLTLTFAHAQSKVRVTIAPPAISASSALISAAKHKRAGKLTITVAATDASGRVTTFSLKLKPS